MKNTAAVRRILMNALCDNSGALQTGSSSSHLCSNHHWFNYTPSYQFNSTYDYTASAAGNGVGGGTGGIGIGGPSAIGGGAMGDEKQQRNMHLASSVSSGSSSGTANSSPFDADDNNNSSNDDHDTVFNAGVGIGADDYLRRVMLRHPGTRELLEIQVVHGKELSEEKVDAVVNPANPLLTETAALNDCSFAILQRGGPMMKEMCQKWLRENGGQARVGTAVVFPASGLLACRYLINAIGPSWTPSPLVSASSKSEFEDSDSDVAMKDHLLEKCILASLEQADHLGAQSIALPAVSTFLNGGPKARVARIMFDSIVEKYFLLGSANKKRSLRLIRLVNTDEVTSSCLASEFDRRCFFSSPICAALASKFELPLDHVPKGGKPSSSSDEWGNC